jgi:hypothetical protein
MKTLEAIRAPLPTETGGASGREIKLRRSIVHSVDGYATGRGPKLVDAIAADSLRKFCKNLKGMVL